MSLRYNFEKMGNWLFRRRSFLPLLLVVPIYFAMLDYDYFLNSHTAEYIWEAFCLLVSFGGLALRAWAVGSAAKGTSGRNTKSQIADELNTTGIYSVVRHPLYIGNYCMMLGVVLFAHHLWLVLTFTLLFVLYYERIMFAEEAYLSEKFGPVFHAWAQKTPAIFPRLSLYRPSSVPWSLKKVIRNEYNGSFAVVISMFCLRVYGDWLVNGRLLFDPVWLVVLGVSALVWLGVRIIKASTNWLKSN
jgi:protein-S-isoprenylcysteine O-methyltransferase Ste14